MTSRARSAEAEPSHARRMYGTSLGQRRGQPERRPDPNLRAAQRGWRRPIRTRQRSGAEAERDRPAAPTSPLPWRGRRGPRRGGQGSLPRRGGKVGTSRASPPGVAREMEAISRTRQFGCVAPRQSLIWRTYARQPTLGRPRQTATGVTAKRRLSEVGRLLARTICCLPRAMKPAPNRLRADGFYLVGRSNSESS